MRRGAALLALLLALVAAPAPAGSQTGPDSGAGSTAGEVTDLVNALLGVLMGEGEVRGRDLQEEVARVGGVPFRWDVEVAFMGRSELAGYLQELLDSEYPRERARTDERLLAAFDLLEPGTDLRALRARLLEDNVAGFYDERPGRRRLYSVSEDHTFTPMNQIVLVHELRHALQDQYEELHASLSDEVCDFDDRRLAWMALLEGDATLVMERFVQSRLGLGTTGGVGDGGGLDSGLAAFALADLAGTPSVVRDQLLLPYLVGRELARAIEARGGADAMREAWRRPPESTEQVLHPEKFFARESPLPVAPPHGPWGGRLIAEGVLGELLLRTLLEEGGESPATEGWGGDAWRLWDVGGRTVLAWRSVWDSPWDVDEFEAGFRARFAGRWGAGERRGPWTVFEGVDGWHYALRRDGDAVELLSTDDGASLGALPD